MGKIRFLAAVSAAMALSGSVAARQSGAGAGPAPPMMPLSEHNMSNALPSRPMSLPVVPIAPPPPPVPVIRSMNGSFLYVYSFLEIRQAEYTAKVLDQFYADLAARMGASHITTKIYHYSASTPGEFYSSLSSQGRQSGSVPVMQTIAGNLRDERAFGARFRLIVFPSSYTLSGAWRFYQIRFVVMDAVSNARLLNFVYSGKHLVMLKNSENAEARSKKILDQLFAQLDSTGLLRVAAETPAAPAADHDHPS